MVRARYAGHGGGNEDDEFFGYRDKITRPVRTPSPHPHARSLATFGPSIGVAPSVEWINEGAVMTHNGGIEPKSASPCGYDEKSS
jgi:hypothetical protein